MMMITIISAITIMTLVIMILILEKCSVPTLLIPQNHHDYHDKCDYYHDNAHGDKNFSRSLTAPPRAASLPLEEEKPTIRGRFVFQ